MTTRKATGEAEIRAAINDWAKAVRNKTSAEPRLATRRTS
jgi:ketosteroid isomerase-like protein